MKSIPTIPIVHSTSLKEEASEVLAKRTRVSRTVSDIRQFLNEVVSQLNIERVLNLTVGAASCCEIWY